MTERELQNKFVEWLKLNKKDNQFLFEEVDTYCGGMTDVVLYDGNKNNGYELKLTDIKKVIKQANRNTCIYERIYIVMPMKQILKIKQLKEMPYKENQKKYGLIGYEDNKFILVRNSKINKPIPQYKFTMMDRIIRGFHLNGVNARKSYR